MGLLEFSLSRMTPCECEGSYFAFGYYDDEKPYRADRLPKTPLGRNYEGHRSAELEVLKLYAFAKRLSAMAIVKMCDGDVEKGECKEPTLSIVENVLFTPMHAKHTAIKPVLATPMVPNGIWRATVLTPEGEPEPRYPQYLEPTIYMPHTIEHEMSHAANYVVELVTSRVDHRPVYGAIRGDEHLVEP